MATPVEEIKNKLRIEDVVGGYIKLEKAGANFRAKCPFHNEKTPSFFVSPERGSYYCFGCGAKGDIFSFVQQFEGLDFVGALRVLAEKAGVQLKRVGDSPGAFGATARERGEKERLYLLLEHTTLFYQRQLAAKADALKYLHDRGLSDKTLKDWRVGYAPAEWQALSGYLKSKDFTDKEIETTGMAKKSEKGSGVYDRFRGRVMFPLFDTAGRVIAFSGRQLESDGTEAKYINSPETVLFQKSRVLYGWNKARLEIRQKGQAILVEGQMDLLACHQAGLVNSVATSGTALTAEHVALIKRLADKLVICYDADTAGQNAAAKGFGLALAAGLDVTIATFPAGQDPAEVAKEDPKKLVTFVSAARHIIDVELERIMTRNQGIRDSNQTKDFSHIRERDKAVERNLLPYVAVLESQIERSRFIASIAHVTGIKEALLWDEVKKLGEKSGTNIPRMPRSTAEVTKNTKLNRLETLNHLLWGLVFLLDKNPATYDQKLDIRQKISTIVGVSEFAVREQEALVIKDELLFEAELGFVSGDDGVSVEKAAADLLADFEEEWLKEALAEAARKGAPAGAMNELVRRRQAVRERDTKK